MTRPMLSAQDFEAAIRAIGAERYHNLHPFHQRLHSGGCALHEVQAWALNRYCYQEAVPRKDAAFISRATDRALRREWVGRLLDHDGFGEEEGGIERWLVLTDGLGFARDYVISRRGALPATKFAVEAYVRFVREEPLVVAVASSLTELFAPAIHRERIAGMLENYAFIDDRVMAYFKRRLTQAPKDSDFALAFIKSHCQNREEQDACIEAVRFKCDVLWTQLDALWHAYVTGAIPPGAWRPGEGMRQGHAASDEDARMTTPMADERRPRLPRGVRLKHDEVRNEWLLLAPERVVKANEIARAILERCDGARSVDDIIDDLATQYNADRAIIARDTVKLLEDLATKRMLDL